MLHYFSGVCGWPQCLTPASSTLNSTISFIASFIAPPPVLPVESHYSVWPALHLCVNPATWLIFSPVATLPHPRDLSLSSFCWEVTLTSQFTPTNYFTLTLTGCYWGRLFKPLGEPVSSLTFHFTWAPDFWKLLLIQSGSLPLNTLTHMPVLPSNPHRYLDVCFASVLGISKANQVGNQD